MLKVGITLLLSKIDPLRALNRQSVVFRGVCALLLQQRVLDFSSGEAITDVKYFNDRIDSHHISPQAWCRARGIDSRRANCIVNKTLLSAKTNNQVGNRPPGVYLADLEQKGISRERLDDILRSHLIEPEALRADDFEAFFNARSQVLTDLVGRVMGKFVNLEMIQEIF
jgi:hypothetical protein